MKTLTLKQWLPVPLSLSAQWSLILFLKQFYFHIKIKWKIQSLIRSLFPPHHHHPQLLPFYTQVVLANISLLLCMTCVWCGGGHVCLSACVKTRGQVGRVSYLLLLLVTRLASLYSTCITHWTILPTQSSPVVRADERTCVQSPQPVIFLKVYFH